MRASNTLATSSQKPSWDHNEWVWIKNGRKRWESGFKIGCQNEPTKKLPKLHWEFYLFWWDHMLCKVASMLIPYFHYLSTMHKRMTEKGEFLGEFQLSKDANDDWRKTAKFDNQTYLRSWKGPETSQQSIRNLSLCVISMVEKRMKERNTSKPQWQLLTCVYHFFCLSLDASLLQTAVDTLQTAVFAADENLLIYLLPGTWYYGVHCTRLFKLICWV